MGKYASTKSGFILVETLVGLSLLTLSIGTSTYAYSQITSSITRIRDYDAALSFAQNALNALPHTHAPEIMLTPFTPTLTKATIVLPNSITLERVYETPK